MKLYVITAKKLIANFSIVFALFAAIGLNYSESASVLKTRPQENFRFTTIQKHISYNTDFKRKKCLKKQINVTKRLKKLQA